MELKTISEVSRIFGISTRTLRYYEQIGLVVSTRKDGYAYRVYDENSILCLQQIIILRKLRIPLKEINEILSGNEAALAIKVFKKNVIEITEEVNALSTIKEILDSLINKLQKQGKLNLLSDDSIADIIDSLSLQKTKLKEEKSMEDLNKATESLSLLKNVRIIHLPPCTIAASHCIGENPEDNAGKQLKNFIQESKLYKIKPDARVFGFNHPNPSPEKSIYGYELWVTIQEDMEVPKPLKKKHFNGGLYAAHTIVFPNFHEWQLLQNWVTVENEKYESNSAEDNGEFMCGLLEEHINYVYNASFNWQETDELQLDLLYPIKLKGNK
ncbi:MULTISPECIES: effector binding domain-containing protein [unclassified Clostridium]|uniref:effector binding domain-containing protein n=1 Tax=unclassified Clostridium TaxID=2614128 RepID=UPI000297A590|nr:MULTISPECIES: effector binding domain-containing protein [unclassified Clostridium]EKQ57503.1 MAG: putative transcriptional regulator [Clostridium sp. Maddingley MBC34-26]